MRYDATDLEAMPTLSTGQSDNLKVDDGTERVWLSRCTVADGEPYNNRITHEHLRNGRWEEGESYPG